MLNFTQLELRVARQVVVLFVALFMLLRLFIPMHASAAEGIQGHAAIEEPAKLTAANSNQAAEEALVLKKILQQQQSQPTQTQAQQAITQQPNKPDIQRPIPIDGEAKIQELPQLNQPVVDLAQVLSPAEIKQLNQQILNIYQSGQAQIAIVIVPTTGHESIFDFAMRVGEQWKLGSSKTDNGMVIAVAVNDQRIHIATGYGLEGVIPDIVAGQIIRNQIQPAFRQAEYGKGLSLALSEIQRILDLDPTIAAQAAQDLKYRQAQAVAEQESQDKLFSAGLIIFVIGAIASSFFGRGISASTSAVTGFAAGMIYGVGIIGSLMLAVGLFFLLITPLAQLILQAVLSGRGGGGRGGGRGGGGYRGGGGGFGGGGASGSW